MTLDEADTETSKQPSATLMLSPPSAARLLLLALRDQESGDQRCPLCAEIPEVGKHHKKAMVSIVLAPAFTSVTPFELSFVYGMRCSRQAGSSPPRTETPSALQLHTSSKGCVLIGIEM
nr:uncharacterized protein LOC105492400 [Macaca nemestrina]